MGEIADTVRTQLGITIQKASAKPPPIKINSMQLMKAIIESAPRSKQDPRAMPAPARPQETTKPEPTNKRVEEVAVPEAKEKPKPKIKKKVIKPQVKKEDIFTEVQKLDGVHIELYDYFDVSPSLATPKDLERLQEIHAWAFDKADKTKALKKLNDLELKLGRSAMGDGKLNNIYNYIKVRELV